MKKYRVYLVTEASTTIEVEAESPEEAIELAFEEELPYAPGYANYQLGEWNLASEVNTFATAEDDWDEVS